MLTIGSPDLFLRNVDIIRINFTMTATSGAVSFINLSEVSVGLTSPKPPSLTARASRSLVSFEHGGHPFREGMSTWWMASSKGWKRSLIP